jgi:hypothetical protein
VSSQAVWSEVQSRVPEAADQRHVMANPPGEDRTTLCGLIVGKWIDSGSPAILPKCLSCQNRLAARRRVVRATPVVDKPDPVQEFYRALMDGLVRLEAEGSGYRIRVDQPGLPKVSADYWDGKCAVKNPADERMGCTLVPGHSHPIGPKGYDHLDARSGDAWKM